ncbi:OPT family oligopeptide transporter, partial [Paenibacillus larvae]
GAGAVATGGLITLVKTLPMLYGSLRDTFRSFKNKNHGTTNDKVDRTDRDIPALYVVLAAAILIIIIAVAPLTDVGFIGAIAIAIFGFLFVMVASRIVGLVGSSSSPVSGMTIATLLIVTFIFKMTGMTGSSGMVAALTVGAIVCTALAVAGDISQDLKTGYLVGGTPWKQQVAMMIGVLVSGLTIGFILSVLHQTYVMGSEQLPAPKAILMKMIVEGIMSNNLPWDLIFIGAGAAVMIEFLGLNSLTVAVGIYLPITTSAPIMVGGLVKWLVDFRNRNKAPELVKSREETGILFASGLIAGESLLGVVIAIIIWLAPNAIGDNPLFTNNLLPTVVFLFVVALLYFVIMRAKQVKTGK